MKGNAKHAERKGNEVPTLAPKKEQSAAPEPLTQLSVPELQARYLEVVGRPTGSDNKAYLVWKIREAQKGRIPVGPRVKGAPRAKGAFKVLPLRMEAHAVELLDKARQHLGLPSRMALIRRALHAYLLEAGEPQAAAPFAPNPDLEANA